MEMATFVSSLTKSRRTLSSMPDRIPFNASHTFALVGFLTSPKSPNQSREIPYYFCQLITLGLALIAPYFFPKMEGCSGYAPFFLFCFTQRERRRRSQLLLAMDDDVLKLQEKQHQYYPIFFTLPLLPRLISTAKGKIGKL